MKKGYESHHPVGIAASVLFFFGLFRERKWVTLLDYSEMLEVTITLRHALPDGILVKAPKVAACWFSILEA